MKIFKISKVHGEEAQGVVEFALISMIMLFFFLGTVDLGRFFYYGTAVRNAARVGAEVASNASCPNVFLCGRLDPTLINDYVMQATVCEPNGAQRVVLQPTLNCSTCIDSECTGATSPCSSTACTPCDKDVCIERFNQCASTPCDPCASSLQGAPYATSTNGQCVRVIVGYNFKPISPLIGKFFGSKQCWTAATGARVDDSTTHTICATATGKVY